MSRRIVIVGCGGFGREVHDVIDAINASADSWELLGYVDDDPSDVNVRLIEARGFKLLGSTDWFADANLDSQYVIGIGTGQVRRRIDEKLSRCGIKAAALTHPSATLGYDVRVGEGTIICAGVRATTNISIGRHVHINLNCTVGHDSALDDYVTVNPLVAISGWVTVGAASMLGTHSAILQNLSVGSDSVVGAGSCVVRNVAPNTVVKGVPAK
jgi:hypothetical protein